MNNAIFSKTKSAVEKIKSSGRIRDILLLAVLALIVLFAAWKLFYGEQPQEEDVGLTQTEKKVALLIENISGVGKANVVVCETEDGVQSVVVVCEGANDLQVVINVREAVAAALGAEEKNVKIYLKKE